MEDADGVDHSEAKRSATEEVSHSTADVDAPKTNIDPNPGWGLYNNLSVHSEWDAIMSELGICKSPVDIEEKDLLGKRFRTYETADVFYQIYSAVQGFGVRKGALRLNVRGQPNNRTWLCCKEVVRETKYIEMPHRVRTARGITREGCPAKLRINLCKHTTEWVVKAFTVQHSHRLATQPWVQYMRDKRKVSGGAMTTVRNLRDSGIKTSKIMSYIAQQVGGYDNVRFIVKDLYNHLNRDNVDAIAEGDAERAIGYLQSKADVDVDFYGRFAYDEKNRLLSLFWADSTSRADYERFGDVLSFDTTYKTNLYGRPLLVFVGVNNHFRSTAFGYAIMINEVAETYIWALKAFIDCMHGVQPNAVITDGDPAMRAAIVEVMPNTVHRLCSWHIENNVVTHVKDPSFLPLIKKLMFKKFAVDEFERRWVDAIACHGLEGNRFVQQLYEKRHLWANTFLGTTFFAGMSTTQRCEKMNSLIKSKVTRHMTLVEFLRGIEHTNSWLRHRQGEDEYKSFWSKPVANVSNMPLIEAAVAAIYTPTIFYKVQNELRREGKYLVTKLEEAEGQMKAVLTKYADKDKRIVVQYCTKKYSYACECNLLISKGFPCRHIFSCMKAMHADTFPPTLVVDRWRRSVQQRGSTLGQKKQTSGTSFDRARLRFGHMNSKCSELSHLAAKSEEAFEFASKAVAHLTGQLHSMVDYQDTDADVLADTEHVGAGLKNPTYTSTKGGWSGSKRGGKGKKSCSICNRSGHNKATCTANDNMSRKKRRADSAKDFVPEEDGDDMEGSVSSYNQKETQVDGGTQDETSEIMERIGKGWWANWL